MPRLFTFQKLFKHYYIIYEYFFTYNDSENIYMHRK